MRSTHLIALLTGLVLAACGRANAGSAPAADAGSAPAADGTTGAASASTPPAAVTSSPPPAAAPADSALAWGGFPGSYVATYVATDFAFGGPDRIPAGLTTIRLVNKGGDLHHLQLLKLTGGKTAQDFAAVMQSAGPETPPPAWVVSEGGPNAVVPGDSSNATAVLEPGSYLAVCWIPSADGKPHVAKGMLAPIEVVAEERHEEWKEPDADVTVKLVDYDFQLPASFAPGRHVVRVENAGDEAHELVLWRLAPGKALGDLTAWAEGGFQGPPPALPIGGVTGVKPGGHAYFVTDLAAGDYALICFLPDDEDGKMHLEHGMAKQFRVG